MTKRKADAKSAGSDLEVAERTLPHDLDAERCVLGAILLHNDAYLQAVQHVRRNDFFRDSHRRVFEAMERLLERPQGCVDMITLKDELAKRNDLDEVGVAYLAKLVDGIPRSTNVKHYAQIVAEKSQLRNIIYASNAMLTEAYSAEESAASILKSADQTLVELQYGRSSGAMQSLAHGSQAMLSRLEYLSQHRGELRGLDTGFQSINDQTMGWTRGDFIVVAARPSIGKTAFTLNTAVAGAKSLRLDGGKPHVAIFSLEMRAEQLHFRMLSSLSGVAATTIIGGWMTDDQWGPLASAVGVMDELNIHIDDTPAVSLANVRAACRRLRAEHGLDLVIVDYVQLMSEEGARRGANRAEALAFLCGGLKQIARELDVPLIGLSQLSRASDKRDDVRPRLSDLSESSAFEKDADIVCFLHRKDHRAGGCTNFIIEKQRNGPTATLNLTFDREFQRFTDGGEEPAPTETEKQANKKADDQHAKVKAIIKHRQKQH